MSTHDDGSHTDLPDLSIPSAGSVLTAIEVRATDDADLTELLLRLREAGADVVTINSFPATKKGEDDDHHARLRHRAA